MDAIPLSWQFGALAVLLVVSAFFSIAETSMMALNRYRLKHLVGQGHEANVADAVALESDTHEFGGLRV